MWKHLPLKQIFALIVTFALLLACSGMSHPVIIQAATITPPPTPVTATDPATWPVISAANASYLTLERVYGHGKNRQAMWAGDGHTVIVGGDRGVWFYDVRTPQAPPIALDEPDLPVKSMVVSHDGKSLAVSAGEELDGYGSGGSIRVWDIASRALKINIPANTIPISFSPDDTQIIGYGLAHGHFAPGQISIWDIRSGSLLVSANSFDWLDDVWEKPPSNIVRLGIGLQLIAVIYPHGDIGIWSISPELPGKSQPTLPGNYAESQSVIALTPAHFASISTDKHFLTLNWANHWLWVIDLNAYRLMDIIDVFTNKPPDPSVSPDGKTRVQIEDDVITLRDAHTGNFLTTLSGRSITDFAFSYDDRSLALLSGDQTVDIIDVASKKAKFSLVGHTGPILRLAFSPDTRWIATISDDQTIRLWDAATGQEHRIWYPGDRSTALAFSPDSQILAVSGSQGIVRLWDVNTDQLRTIVYGLDAKNEGLVFHPDGTLSVYSDNSLVQWDWEHLQERIVPFSQDAHTYIYQVSPDGATTLATAPYGCEVPSVVIFDNHSGKVAKVVDDCALYISSFAYSTDGSLLISALNLPGNDGLHGPSKVCIATWDHDLKCLDSIDGAQDFGKAAFSQSGRIVAAINEEGALVVWRINDPRSDDVF